jgi:hypothetical protein
MTFVARGLWLSRSTLGVLWWTAVQSPILPAAPLWQSQLRFEAQDLVHWHGRVAVLRRGGDARLPLVWLHDEARGRAVASFGREGVGPGEVLGPMAVTVASLTDELWILDLPRRRWVGFAYADGEPQTRRVVAFPDGNTVLDAVWRDRSVVATGFFSKGAFAVLDSASGPVRYLGAAATSVVGADQEVGYHRGRARLAMAPGGLVVLARLLQPRLEFYDLSGRLVAKSIDAWVGENPLRIVRDPAGQARVLSDPDTRYAYLDLAVAWGRVLALYSGRSERSNGSAAPNGNVIQVFSVAGECLGTAVLTVDLNAIEVDEEQSMLFGVGPGVEGQRGTLYAFRLSDILRVPARAP